MKKFLVIFIILLLSLAVSKSYAEVVKYTAYGFSMKSTDSRGNWSNWSDWKSCNVLIVMDSNKERMTIYSQETQVFDIISYEDSESDGESGKITPLSCVDQDGLRCTLRYRQQKNGDLQLYVDYNNLMYVYNVRYKY